MKKLSIHDLWSSVLIGIIAYLSFFQWRYSFPFFTELYDIFYHLSISSGFLRAGGFVTQNFWDCAPYVTNSLYPPFFHILQYLLLACGLSKLFVVNLTWLFYPLSFVTLWLFMRNCYSPRIGFYAIFLLSVPGIWFEKIYGHPTNALLLVITPLIFWALIRQRYFVVAILSSLSLVTNVNGIFIILAVILCLLHRPKDSQLMLGLFLMICLMAIPFILTTCLRIYHYHLKLLFQKNFFGFSFLELGKLIDPSRHYGFLGLVSIAGFFICYRLKGKYLILPAFFLANLPALLLNYDLRFWINVLLSLVMLGAVFLNTVHEKATRFRRGRLLGVLFFLLVIISSNFLFTAFEPVLGKKRQTAFMRLAVPTKPWGEVGREDFKKQAMELAESIKNNCAENESFFVDAHENIKKMLGALSGRSVTYGLGARVVILRKDKIPPIQEIPGLKPGDEQGFDQSERILRPLVSGGFSLDFIKDAGIYYVYKETNQDKIKRVVLPHPVIPLREIIIYLSILFLILLADVLGLSRWCSDKLA